MVGGLFCDDKMRYHNELHTAQCPGRETHLPWFPMLLISAVESSTEVLPTCGKLEITEPDGRGLLGTEQRAIAPGNQRVPNPSNAEIPVYKSWTYLF